MTAGVEVLPLDLNPGSAGLGPVAGLNVADHGVDEVVVLLGLPPENKNKLRKKNKGEGKERKRKRKLKREKAGDNVSAR